MFEKKVFNFFFIFNIILWNIMKATKKSLIFVTSLNLLLKSQN